MNLQIPTVTVDDLRHFHSKHLPDAPLPTQYLAGAEDTASTEDAHYEDDGLGYYDDGAKRAITDEQVAMFRHTEIHAILRARRRKREREEDEEEGEVDDESSPKRAKSIPPGDAPTAPPKELPIVQAAEADADSKGLSATQLNPSGKESGGDTTKYKNNWTAVSAKSKARNHRIRKRNRENRKEKKRQSREGSTPSKATNEDQDGDESDEWDPWHQANGPDAQQSANVELDY
ncbi:hypothetical protein BDV96DRAFT_597397 [Lophiotrema nucula]|uniref:Uncharacterized protein n=1 Tax=Lophiotrema nucula TaxID=690887 RepID=A0A6A5ZIA5_9PLEO|nr:hypothetical protein BDV96DRAFT_597397 [Lophiotrema nucula]